MNLFRLIFRQTWQSGGLGLLLAALILAVTATTTLRFAADSVRDAIAQQAGQLLAADLVLTSDDPLDPIWQQRATDAGLRQSSVVLFSSMLQAKDEFSLVNVKAVNQGFPLRGELVLSPAGLPAGQAPEIGTVWLEPRLATLMRVKQGDPVQIGDATLTVMGEISRDPNRETGFSGFSPTVLINAADIGKTNAVQVGSRIDYRLLMAGTPDQVRAFERQWSKQIDATEDKIGEINLRSASDGNTRLMRPVRLLNDYGQVAGLLTLLLCGLAIALTTRRLVAQQLDSIALVRCLGASRPQLVTAYLQILLCLWAVAVLVGMLLGGLSGYGLLTVLRQGLQGVELPFMWATLLTGPVLTAAVTALLMLLGFAIPSLLRLLNVSPLRVLRSDVVPATWSGFALTAVAWLALFGFVLLQTGKLALSLSLIIGLAVLLALMFGVIYAVLLGLKRSGWLQDALVRQPVASSVRVLSLSLGLGLVGVVLLLRGDLLNRWQQSLPVGTPNHFIYGLPSDQTTAFTDALAQRQLTVPPLYPMVRGRLTQINGQPLSAEVAEDRTAQRELNLTMAKDFANSPIVAGQPFSAPNQVSVEQEVAARLGMALGDRVTMSLPEGDIEATIVSLRSVDWDSFQPNFFFIYSPETLQPSSGSYLGSLYIAPEKRAQLPSLIREFPAVLLIDVDAILAEIRRLLDLLGQALGLLAGLVGVSGLLVLLASLRIMVDERQSEVALLRAFGLSRRQLRRRLLGEMALLGAISGVFAVVLAEGLALIIAWRLELPLRLHLEWWLMAPLLLTLLAVLTGLRPLAKLWQQSPLAVLQRRS